MSKRIVIVGYGAVGRATAPLLASRGDVVAVAQRRQPSGLPASFTFLSANVADRNDAFRACAGADAVVCAVGVPYVSEVYIRLWPTIMSNLLEGCTRSAARFVFADSLYMYGPQTRPLTEDMPLTSFGKKPRVRAAITRQWQEAHQARRVRAVAVRASDFYGPDVPTSVLSTYGVARLLSGKPALAPYPPDKPHDSPMCPISPARS
jgi:nucleoside-diphosphate-sugar epimerase